MSEMAIQKQNARAMFSSLFLSPEKENTDKKIIAIYWTRN